MAQLPDAVVERVEHDLGCTVISVAPVGGGCIANATRVTTSQQQYFLKWALAPAGETFVEEASGLRALRAVGSSLIIPQPIAVHPATFKVHGMLLMEWVEEGTKDTSFWKRLGAGLAALHRGSGATSFGWESDNFIGRLPQKNDPSSNWVEFFASRRIFPQVEMARRLGRWMRAWDAGFEGLLQALPSLLPVRPHASLVHGDLWSGNVLATVGNEPVLIDPAVYCGDREVDIALSELFGGFPKEFYSAYDAAWELDNGYPERRDVYNLYHLVNHLNHFGNSYGPQVAGILRRFA